MKKITLGFLESQISKINKDELKILLGKKRLKFTSRDIAVLLFALYSSQKNFTYLKKIYHDFVRKSLINTTYQGFMYSLNVVSPVAEILFKNITKKSRSTRTLVVDTTLLPQKERHCINWSKDQNRTVSRGYGQLVCGVKVLMISTTDSVILYLDVGCIRKNDAKIITEEFVQKVKTFNPKHVLLDKGFASDPNRELFREFSILPVIPYKDNQPQKLTLREKDLYSERFSIENIFKVLKDPQGDIRLIMKKIRRGPIVRAKVFLAGLAYNLSRKKYCLYFSFDLDLINYKIIKNTKKREKHDPGNNTQNHP